jgi:hypothetical protein
MGLYILKDYQIEVKSGESVMSRKSLKMKNPPPPPPKKARCINCGATKVESNDCKYCGT